MLLLLLILHVVLLAKHLIIIIGGKRHVRKIHFIYLFDVSFTHSLSLRSYRQWKWPRLIVIDVVAGCYCYCCCCCCYCCYCWPLFSDEQSLSRHRMADIIYIKTFCCNSYTTFYFGNFRNFHHSTTVAKVFGSKIEFAWATIAVVSTHNHLFVHSLNRFLSVFFLFFFLLLYPVAFFAHSMKHRRKNASTNWKSNCNENCLLRENWLWNIISVLGIRFFCVYLSRSTNTAMKLLRFEHKSTWKQSQIHFSTDCFRHFLRSTSFTRKVTKKWSNTHTHTQRERGKKLQKHDISVWFAFGHELKPKCDVQKILFLWSFTPANGYLCIICLFISPPGFY